jgi:hypothetical protein
VRHISHKINIYLQELQGLYWNILFSEAHMTKYGRYLSASSFQLLNIIHFLLSPTSIALVIFHRIALHAIFVLTHMTKLFLVRTSFLVLKTLLFVVKSVDQSLHSLQWSKPNSFIFKTIVHNFISHTSYLLFPLLWLFLFTSNNLCSCNMFFSVTLLWLSK